MLKSVMATGPSQVTSFRINCSYKKVKKGKGFPYSTPSVGPGADPGVQAVSLQVTVSHPPGGRLPLRSARPAVTSAACSTNTHVYHYQTINKRSNSQLLAAVARHHAWNGLRMVYRRHFSKFRWFSVHFPRRLLKRFVFQAFRNLIPILFTDISAV